MLEKSWLLESLLNPMQKGEMEIAFEVVLIPTGKDQALFSRQLNSIRMQRKVVTKPAWLWDPAAARQGGTVGSFRLTEV